jgi:hypothetical protein
MTSDPNSLIHGYFDELLSEEQIRALNDWIKEDPRNAQQFASFALMHDGLHDHLRSRAVLEGDRPGAGAELRWNRRRADASSWRRHRAAVLVIGVGLTLLAVWTAHHGLGDGTVATVVEARDVVWADGQAPIAVNARLKPRVIRCRSGMLKFAFDSGALVTVEGFANLEVLSGMRIRTVRGRITARVDDRAKGFSVETPNTVVVDQGTEFGVEVDDSGQTGVVVFEGRVDLTRTESTDRAAPIKRLGQGEGLRIGASGSMSRIVAVERRPGDDAWSTGPAAYRGVVIRSVRDNIRGPECSKYYQIVHGGLDDDVPAYVDRLHQWNGLNAGGLPGFLRGADYIMPFNDDKWMKELQVTIEVMRPATLFVFFDDREKIPLWLSEQFIDTGIDIGLDECSGPTGEPLSAGRGPGVSIDHVLSIWKCELEEDESITLGALLGRRQNMTMYGIAAVPRP